MEVFWVTAGHGRGVAKSEHVGGARRIEADPVGQVGEHGDRAANGAHVEEPSKWPSFQTDPVMGGQLSDGSRNNTHRRE